jgi:peptide/nickel transport system ATP-binding protein
VSDGRPGAPDPGPDGERPVLEARGLSKTFRGRGGRRQPGAAAVSALDLALWRGRITALVGQSGSGKSTTARLLARLERPDAGSIALDGQVSGRQSAAGYRRAVQMVFQDPFASLNPAHTVAYHLSRPLRLHGSARSKADVRRASTELLERVSLRPGDALLRKFPHELSGGQRQRVAIALALAVGPRVLLADEPVSMLDVSIRIGVLNLLKELAGERRLALLYITHDIASARYFADDIMVMYGGIVVERGSARDVVERPAHPYTRLLVAAAPHGGRDRGAPAPLPQRSPPAAGPLGAGCVFAQRCPNVMPRCLTERPREVPYETGRSAACFLYDPADEYLPASPGLPD